MCINIMFYETLTQKLSHAVDKVNKSEISKNIDGMKKGLVIIESTLKELAEKAEKDRESVAVAISKMEV